MEISNRKLSILNFLFKDHRWFWISLGLITLGINLFVRPDFIEKFYSRGIFLYIRKGFDFITNVIPIPLFYYQWQCVQFS